jgi:hypothetical protein
MCYERRRAEACVDGTREEPGTLIQGAPVFPGSSRLGIEPKTPGWLVQDPTTSPSGDLIPTIRGSGAHPGRGVCSSAPLTELIPVAVNPGNNCLPHTNRAYRKFHGPRIWLTINPYGPFQNPKINVRSSPCLLLSRDASRTHINWIDAVVPADRA